MSKSTALILAFLLSAAFLFVSPGNACAVPQSAKSLYNTASRQMSKLAKNPKKRRQRANWERSIAAFDQVAKKYPRSPYAPLALFSKAEAYEGLYRASRNDRDLDAAIEAYQTFVAKYPKNGNAGQARVRLKALTGMDQAAIVPQGTPSKKTVAQEAPIRRGKGRLVTLQAPGLPRLSELPEPERAEPSETITVPPAPEAAEADTARRPVENEPVNPAHARQEPKFDAPSAGMPTPEVEVQPAPAPSPPPPAPPTVTATTAAAKPSEACISTIVIDPGHGGKDTGAIGPTGLREKDVVLDIALMLRDMITSSLGCKVVMTRDSDVFIELDKRPVRQKDADLFISIHANASRDRAARGIETYLLNTTKDRNIMELAARENMMSLDRMSDLYVIIKDLVLDSKRDKSLSLAHAVQASLVGDLKDRNSFLNDKGVKQGPFWVLYGAEMPSILIEVGFISNREEEQLLASHEYRQGIAAAILDGVRQYINTTKVASGFGRNTETH